VLGSCFKCVHRLYACCTSQMGHLYLLFVWPLFLCYQRRTPGPRCQRAVHSLRKRPSMDILLCVRGILHLHMHPSYARAVLSLRGSTIVACCLAWARSLLDFYVHLVPPAGAQELGREPDVHNTFCLVCMYNIGRVLSMRLLLSL
jgi:hypothetical protein